MYYPECRVCGTKPFVRSVGRAGAETLHDHFFGKGELVENRHSTDCCHGGCRGQLEMAEHYCPSRFRGGISVPRSLETRDAIAEFIKKTEEEVKKTKELYWMDEFQMVYLTPEEASREKRRISPYSGTDMYDRKYYI